MLSPVVRQGGGRSGLVVMLVVGVAVVWVNIRPTDSVAEGIPDQASVEVADPVADDAGAQGAAMDSTAPLQLGTAGPVRLAVPGADPVVVSFHEASLPQALGVTPAGVLIRNENTTRFTAPAAIDGAVPYQVQVSRGRANSPTSAVDIALPDGAAVLSPVTGVVGEVRSYDLYGTYEDVRLELHPDGAPGYAVVLIHVEGVEVQAGDRVEVGDVLARNARRFPFDAVIDRATAPARYGHVHLEVKLLEP